MKISGVLGGLLMLFQLAHVHAALTVTCSPSWLLARVDRVPLVDNLQIQPHELTLGSGCPVSVLHPAYFDFVYLLTFCGIRVYEQQLGVFVESVIIYDSVHLDFTLHIPVTCFILRKFPISLVMKREEPVHERVRGVGQAWSLTGDTGYPGSHLGVRSGQFAIAIPIALLYYQSTPARHPQEIFGVFNINMEWICEFSWRWGSCPLSGHNNFTTSYYVEGFKLKVPNNDVTAPTLAA